MIRMLKNFSDLCEKKNVLYLFTPYLAICLLIVSLKLPKSYLIFPFSLTHFYVEHIFKLYIRMHLGTVV